MPLERIVHNSAKVGEDQNMESFDASLNKNYKFYSVGISRTLEEFCISEMIKVFFLEH